MELPAAPTGWQALGPSGRRIGAARSKNEEAFLRLALTHATVTAGDAMVTVALAGSIFFSTDLNGARGRVLLSLVLTMAPFAVVAPFLGPAIDRSKGGRRLMVIVSAAGRAATCLYMARVVHNLLLFLPAALVMLILSKAHSVAKSALVPATVDSPGDLVKAGGRIAVLAAVAGFVGGAPAAVVLKVFDAHWVLRMAAVVYAAGAVMALRTRPAAPAEPAPADHIDATIRSRGVSLAAIAMASLRGISGFLTFAVAFSFRRAHAPTWWYGLVLAGGIVGGFAGNVIGPRLRDHLREERILILGLAIVGASGLFVAFVGGRLLIVLVAVAVGLADGFGQLAFDAIVQRDGSEGSRARSFARYEATFQITWVAAAVLPVALPIPTWLAALLVGLVAVGFAINYALGHYLVGRRPERPPRRAPFTPVKPRDLPTDPTLPPVEADGAPALEHWDPGGVRWSDAEPAPVRRAPAEPPAELPLEPRLPVDGTAGGPRRNPRRARTRE